MFGIDLFRRLVIHFQNFIKILSHITWTEVRGMANGLMGGRVNEESYFRVERMR